jgi:hypothetical protein
MKKMLLLLLCLTLIGSVAFALDKAWGLGVLAGGTFNGGNIIPVSTYGYGGLESTSTGTWSMSRSSFGAFGFFGLSEYMELNFGFLYKAVEAIRVNVGGQTGSISGKDSGIDNTGALQFGVYGKYPIPVSTKFIFFPTAGADFELTLSTQDEWWSDIWIRGGAGLDYFFSEITFLRTQLLYGAAIPVGGDARSFGIDTNFGHGILFKIGVGWMF